MPVLVFDIWFTLNNFQFVSQFLQLTFWVFLLPCLEIMFNFNTKFHKKIFFSLTLMNWCWFPKAAENNYEAEAYLDKGMYLCMRALTENASKSS